MKVLLVSANTLTAPYPVYPLGLDHVAAALRPDHAVRVADLNPLGGNGALGRAVADFAPDVVGLSLRNIDNTDAADPRSFVDRYREIAETVRRNTSAPLILGGSGFTLFPAELMKALAADYGIVGEGERLKPFLDRLDRGRDPKGSEGPEALEGVIAAGGRNGPAAPWNGAFHRRATPAGDQVRYYLDRGGMLNLQTKRGCPFRCVYCTYPHIEGRRMRPIPPEEVARTAMALQRAGARYLFITDSAFNADEDHSLAVARAFRAAGLSIPWGGFFMPIRPPDGYYADLAAAGLSHVEFGTESLSDRVLESYGKPFKTADALAAHRQSVAAGIPVAHYLLPGGPGETPETLEKTLSTVDKLAGAVLFFFCGMRIYPHTKLYEIALKEGRISSDRDLLAPVFYASPAISSSEIMGRIREKARGRANWIFGAGGEETARILARLYERGYTGPLWEQLIPGAGA